MKARLLHAPLLSKSKSYFGKEWSEVVISDGYCDKPIYIAVQTNNPRVAQLVAQALLKKSMRDDILYADFRGGRIHRLIRLKAPAFYFDNIDPRNPNNWQEIAEKSDIAYEEGEETFWLSTITWKNVDFKKLQKIINASRELGDDLLNYVLRYHISNLIKNLRDVGFVQEAIRLSTILSR